MPVVERITHTALVNAARAWLLSRCRLVVAEMWMGFGEHPDAVGWTSNGHSILIECKVSRSDFRADQKKISRVHGGTGIGYKRWYLTPKGLLQQEEVPEGWGLLEYVKTKHSRGYILRRAINPLGRDTQGVNLWAERLLLIEAARRGIEAARLLKPIFTGDENDEE